MMTREQAQVRVDEVTCSVGQLKAVTHVHAFALFKNDSDYHRMMKDPVRNLGPAPGYIYPWNVVDYLSGYRTPREIQEESQRSKKKA